MGNEELFNSAEHAYEKRAEGKLKVARGLLVAGYAVFVAAYFLVCYITRVIPLFAVCPIALWILVFFTWPLVKYDICCAFSHGELTFHKLSRGLRGKRRRELLRVRMADVIKISDYKSEEVDKSYIKLYSSSVAEKLVSVTYKEGDGTKTVVFDSTEAISKLLRSFVKK